LVIVEVENCVCCSKSRTRVTLAVDPIRGIESSILTTVMSPTIVVDNKGTELAYIDSGPPTSGGVYSTIFAVHGVVFASRSSFQPPTL
jgi:hypothetical protein